MRKTCRIAMAIGSILATFTVGACSGNEPREAVERDPEIVDGPAPYGGLDYNADLLDKIQRSPCDIVPEPLPEVVMALTGDTSYAHGVHDCQRLVESGVYGPLVGLFPLARAESAPREEFDDSRGVAVATVYNWGNTTYTPLGIQPGWQCLWLRRSNETWQAALLSPVDGTCPNADARALYGKQRLDVIPLPPNRESPHPATARWEWNEEGDTNLMSVRCGDAWCRIGPRGFRPAPPPPGIAMSPGYYDMNHLMVRDAKGRDRPGPTGHLRPSYQLAGATPRDFRDGLIVAHITVVENLKNMPGLGGYDEKFALTMKNPARGTVNLWMRGEDSVFVAEYHNDTLQVRSKGVVFTRNPHGTRGAVRWNWRPDEDETAWIYCISGCCDAQHRALN